MANVKYTVETLTAAVVQAKNFSDVCRAVGIKPCTGSQTYLAKRIRGLGISYAHFDHNRPSRRPAARWSARPLSAYLDNLFPISSTDLKKKLIAAGLKQAKCENEACGIVEWNGEPAPLELDHVDGNHENNRIENLMILCANCHAIKTAKQIALLRPDKTKRRQPCPNGCGHTMGMKSRTCLQCRSQGHREQPKKITWPSLDVLIAAKMERRVSRLAVELGVSDKAIAYRIQREVRKVRSGSGDGNWQTWLTQNQPLGGSNPLPSI